MAIRIALRRTAGIVAAWALTAGVALAHPGHPPGTGHDAFSAGLLHPLTGFDHLCAMLAVGLWAALTHQGLRQALWTPASFLVLLLAGALAGMAGLHPPAIEPVIMASLLVLGLLIAGRRTMGTGAGAALAGFFAVFHGIAHGAELSPGDSAAAFIAGFMLTTCALHAVGLAAGFAMKRSGAWPARLAGAGIAAYGLALFAGV